MGGSSHTETSNTVDPQLMALYQRNYNRASQVADTPFQPYTGERVAGFNANQTAGFNTLLTAAGDPTAANAIVRAQGTVGSLLNYQAPLIASPGSLAARTVTAHTVGPNLVQAPALNAAPQVGPVNVDAGQLRDTDLAPYLSPYTDDVVNTTLDDLFHARQLQGVADNAGATAAHAFGGTRQAVLDANTSDAYLRNASSTAAGLRQGAFQNAQQAALQDIQNQLGAGEFNSSQAYDAQKFNAANAFDLAKTNAGYQFSADQFNANARTAADQYNANAAMSADQYNAGAGTAADQYNLNTLLDIAKANAANSFAGAGLQLNAAGQYAGLGQAYFNQLGQQGQLYAQVGAQQQALQQAQDNADYEEFLRQLNYPYQQQQLRNQAVSMIPLQQTQATTSGRSLGPADYLGAAASLASFL